MSGQFLVVAAAASLAAVYFVRGAVLDLLGSGRKAEGGCPSCSPSGCPAARRAAPAIGPTLPRR